MKNIFAILIAIALLFTVASCASTDAATAPEGTETSESIEVQDEIENPAPTADVFLLDGFEDGNFFSSNADSTATGVDVSTDWFSEGSTSLGLEFGPNTDNSGKWAMWQCNSIIETDWSSYKYLYFDVKNISDAPVKICFCAMGGQWTWYQNPNEVTVGKEIINVKISLEETVANGTALAGSSDSANMNSMIFAVDGATDGGMIYIDNVRLAND